MAHVNAEKQIVGATETIIVEQANLSFKARVDSGAKTSSIHAINLSEINLGDPTGEPISFELVNKQGKKATIHTHVDSIVTVRTSEGSERRYKVPLTFVFGSAEKTVLVTLNDRSHMNYALVLGRNWLHGDFLVDVEKTSED